MVFDRPNRPRKPQLSNNPNPATRRSNRNNMPSKNNQGNQNSEKLPPIWLKHPLEPNSTPNPDAHAGFVEYLRWMRSHHDYENYPEYDYEDYKDIAKLQILQLAEEKADYRQRLSELNNRTKLIAGEKNYFEVTCAWRIRVGGHRGPESILLPAFDALGMPCILSSTLRGVARTQAIQQFIAEGMTQQQAENEVMKYFGGLDTDNKEDSMGKVIFLDAYPKPTNKSGGLSVDIVNNIWSWENNNLNYKPNPQTFLSLKQSTFVIGIRPAKNCNSQILEKIKNWLITGLQSGIGSQVNTGYGRLVLQNNTEHQQFFKIPFSIQGQLIHGKQKFENLRQPYKKYDGKLQKDKNNKLKPNTSSDAEVRAIAFKSMLRYWFRVFSLGVLPIGSTQTTENFLKAFIKGENTRPPAEVKTLEAILFGSITPQARGWVQFQVTDGKLVQPEAKTEKDDPGEQSGILILNYSSEAPKERLNAIDKLFTNLTWMMFHLGGVGQGARRSCYSRQGRNPEEKPPKWRGSLLMPESDDTFWELPPTVTEFKRLFRQRLQAFYAALQELTGTTINYQQPRTVDLKEAVDKNCRIVVCAGKRAFNKPYALAVLHSKEFKIEKTNRNREKYFVYDEKLCGQSEKPSPVIIADLGDYQVVTIFGANQNKRQQYLKKLEDDTKSKNYAQIFPF